MDDCKNTKEGRIVGQKYADILHLERPEPSAKHPRMSVANRAKIFSPFAALRGFDDEISEEGAQTLRVPKAELSEEEKSALSARLAGLRRGMTVTVRYFVPDLCCPADPPVGRYQTTTGAIQALDPIAKTLRLALEGQPKGPGLEKEKVVTIPFAEIETLQGSGEVV